MLTGKKTYIVAGFAIVYAVSGYISAHLDFNSALQIVLAALATMGIRNGITTEIQALAQLNPSTTTPPQP